MFRDAAPDTDQHLLAGEGQWIFTLNGEKYYLSLSKHHFSLQSVTRPRKMNWRVTRITDLVHVGVITASFHSYTRAGPPTRDPGGGESGHGPDFRQPILKGQR